MKHRFRLMVASSLLSITCASAHAATPPVEPPAVNVGTASANNATLSPLEQAIREQQLKSYGIEPGTAKAATFSRWVDMVKADPDIAALPGGVNDLRKILADRQTRAVMMKSGIARLSVEDRLGLFELMVTLFDRVPENCYGTTNIETVMSRAVFPANMTDEEADRYFRYVYLSLKAFAKHAPLDAPTVAQRRAANVVLGASLEKLITSKEDINRFAAATVNDSQRTPADACWMTSRSLHAIEQVEGPERDVLLRAMFLPEVQPQAQQARPASQPAAKPGVAPTSVQSL